MSRLSNQEVFNTNQSIKGLQQTIAAEGMKLDSMKVYNSDALQADLDQLKGKLQLHYDAVQAEKDAEAKRLSDSKQKLIEVQDTLYDTREKLDAMMPELHHLHKGLAMEFSKMISVHLRKYKPAAETAPKTKKKTA